MSENEHHEIVVNPRDLRGRTGVPGPDDPVEVQKINTSEKLKSCKSRHMLVNVHVHVVGIHPDGGFAFDQKRPRELHHHFLVGLPPLRT